MKKRLTIIIGVHISWGSVEWVLPVCKYLKDHYENVEIIFLVLRKAKSEIFRDNYELKDLVNKISSNQCYDLFDILPKWTRSISILIKFFLINFLYRWKSVPYNEHNKIYRYWFIIVKKVFWKRSIRRWIGKIEPDICLTDYLSEDNIFEDNKNLFFELKKNNVIIGNYPDSTAFTDIDNADYRAIKEKYKKHIVFGSLEYDFYLTDNKWRTDLIRGIVGEQPVFYVGPPKFDTYWINYSRNNYYSDQDLLSKNRYKYNILVLLKNEYGINKFYNNFEDLLNEILSVCLKDENTHLTIKPHPRQNKQLLYKIIS